MAYARLMCKASKIDKLRKELDDEKQKSIEISRDYKSGGRHTLKQKYRHFCMNLVSCFPNCCKKYCTFPKNSCLYKTAYKSRRDGTCENFTIKSVIGFIGGFFLTYIFFMFFVFQLNFKLSTATIMCSIFGSVLTIGLAFSYKVRCVVFLLLPQFFSKRGRQALIAYAFILAITGPAKNILHNVGILSESMACGQQQLKTAVKQILEVIKQPFYAVRDAIKSIVKTIKVIVKQIKEVLLTIKRIIMGIVKVIKAAFQFLGKILNICNKELGTPFERCSKVFEDAIVDCNAKLGPLFNWMCSITYVVQGVCYIVKVLDYICVIVEYVSDSVVGVVTRKVKIFVRHMRTMFYVKIKFSHSFHFETNQSKSINEITTGIVTEMRHRTERLLTVFDIMSCATSLFFVFIILKALHYRFKFLTIDRFDNRFITRDFREIDMVRAQQEKETILPLNHRERAMYISLSSARLVKIERVKLFKAAVVLGTTTLKLSSHMMIDYALYWIMIVIRYHSRFQTNVPEPNSIKVHVSGEGFLARLLKSIVKAFQPLGAQMEIDTIPCLPDPIPPDYDRYVQIATLILSCWILTIFEPYGLRLRHSVMSYYHPTRSRQRSIWLYNHILRSRSSFLKFARRQLKRKFSKSNKLTKITCMEYLRANVRPTWLLMCLGSGNQLSCMLCGEVFRETDPIKPILCAKPSCSGTYCERCFSDLQNLCTICLEPIQYGDLSDISVEKDSSEDEAPAKKKKKRKRKSFSGCCKKKRYDSDDDSDNAQIHPENSSDTDTSHSNNPTSGSSTDNSYTYQQTKDLDGEIIDSSVSQFTDVEKQEIRNEASWDTFKNDLGEYKDDFSVKPKSTSTSSKSSLISEMELVDVNLSPEANEQETKTNGSDSESSPFGRHVSFKDYNVSSSRNTNLKSRFVEDFDVNELKSGRKNASTLTSSVSETSFIEVPKKALLTRKCPICKKNIFKNVKHICKKVLRIPRLNLNFSSPESSSPARKSPQSVIDRFRENIKYESVKETSTSSLSTTPKMTSRENPLRIGYEIYVPRFDKFIDRRELMNVSRKNEEARKRDAKAKFEQKINDFKHQQRKNRQKPMGSDITFKSGPSSSVVKSRAEQASKVKDYYRKIGKMQSIDTISIPKEKNKFVKFMKNLFLKEKTELPRPRFNFHADNYITVVSPKLKYNSSPDYGHSQNSLPSSSTNNNSSIQPSSNTITSSTSSFMGSTVSHQRGGADVDIKNLKASTSDEKHKSEEFEGYESSDSEISDVSVFFGPSEIEQIRANSLRISIAKQESDPISIQKAKVSTVASLKITKEESQSASVENSNRNSTNSKLPSSPTNVRAASVEKPIPRYSREPAERDENPFTQSQEEKPMKLFSNSNQNSYPSELNVVAGRDMQTNYSNTDIISPYLSKIKNEYCSHSTQDDQFSIPGSHNEPYVRSNSGQRQRIPSRSTPDYYNRGRRHLEATSMGYSRYCSATSSTHNVPKYCRCHQSPTRIKKGRQCGGSEYSEGECEVNDEYDTLQNLASTSAQGDNPHKTCRHQDNCPCSRFKILSSPPTSEDGFCSEVSGKSNFPHLVYQNTDEFLDLVNELGDKLSLRNKRRVQKAIREFEVNSRQNKNLEKPVFADDSDDSDQIKKAEQYLRHQATCSRCRKKRRPVAPQCPTKFTRVSTRKESLGKSVPFRGHHCVQQEDKYCAFQTRAKPMRPKYQQNVSSTHWELDPRTGEWFKVYNDYSYENDFYLNLPLPPPPVKQFCDCEKSQRRFVSKRSPERQDRSPVNCKCANCGLVRERRH